MKKLHFYQKLLLRKNVMNMLLVFAVCVVYSFDLYMNIATPANIHCIDLFFSFHILDYTSEEEILKCSIAQHNFTG